MRVRISCPMLRPSSALPKSNANSRADFSKKIVSVNRAAPAAVAVPQERPVVAALGLPLLDRVGRHALRAELHPRHVVGRVDDEEQAESDQVHPDQDRDGVEHPPDDVARVMLEPSGRPVPPSRSRRR